MPVPISERDTTIVTWPVGAMATNRLGAKEAGSAPAWLDRRPRGNARAEHKAREGDALQDVAAAEVFELAHHAVSAAAALIAALIR